MTVAHGFMTMIADDGRGLDVRVSPPTGNVGWVVHLNSYPCNLSIQMDVDGLKRLADRIGQALQDYDIDNPVLTNGQEVP